MAAGNISDKWVWENLVPLDSLVPSNDRGAPCWFVPLRNCGKVNPRLEKYLSYMESVEDFLNDLDNCVALNQACLHDVKPRIGDILFVNFSKRWERCKLLEFDGGDDRNPSPSTLCKVFLIDVGLDLDVRLSYLRLPGYYSGHKIFEDEEEDQQRSRHGIRLAKNSLITNTEVHQQDEHDQGKPKGRDEETTNSQAPRVHHIYPDMPTGLETPIGPGFERHVPLAKRLVLFGCGPIRPADLKSVLQCSMQWAALPLYQHKEITARFWGYLFAYVTELSLKELCKNLGAEDAFENLLGTIGAMPLTSDRKLCVCINALLAMLNLVEDMHEGHAKEAETFGKPLVDGIAEILAKKPVFHGCWTNEETWWTLFVRGTGKLDDVFWHVKITRKDTDDSRQKHKEGVNQLTDILMPSFFKREENQSDLLGVQSQAREQHGPFRLMRGGADDHASLFNQHHEEDEDEDDDYYRNFEEPEPVSTGFFSLFS